MSEKLFSNTGWTYFPSEKVGISENYAWDIFVGGLMVQNPR